ncbi:hypothetical protein CL633_03265 [bacterium]|nr:hypothetical protein [bacterium]|tara:strand:+ start:1633 stop:3432 length:1800 start_codon:yes stop_codon:yes gene_type:complete
MAIRAIIAHQNDDGAKLVLDKMQNIIHRKSLQDKNEARPDIEVINNLNLDFHIINGSGKWLAQTKLQQDEILAIFSDNGFGISHSRNFIMTMEKISKKPDWLSLGNCWMACVCNSDTRPDDKQQKVAENMAHQIWANYFRQFESRVQSGWAPWGIIRDRPSKDWLSSARETQERIDKGQFIDKLLIEMGLVYGPDLATSWMPGLDYFEITKTQFDLISKLVKASFSFKRALCVLYKENKFAREIFNIGRPDFVCNWALQGEQIDPRKVRLDLALTQDGIPMITEIDGTPGGEGMDIGLPRIYQQVIGEPEIGKLPKNTANGYYPMANDMVGENALIMFLITEDSKEYFSEQKVKANYLAKKNIPVIVCSPEDVEIKGAQVFANGQQVIAWDRFVETYELDDSKLRKLAELSEQGFLPAFPPYRHFFWEGKETWAFLHDKELGNFWQKHMGDDFEILKKYSPLTVLPISLRDTKKSEWYRKRASFGDNQCWGSRGVVSGKRDSATNWRAQYLQDCENLIQKKFPYHVYQKAIQHGKHEFYAYDREQERVLKQEFFVRLNPWGYNDGKEIHVCGILATLRYDPRVHGARDALEVPCVIVPD